MTRGAGGTGLRRNGVPRGAGRWVWRVIGTRGPRRAGKGIRGVLLELRVPGRVLGARGAGKGMGKRGSREAGGARACYAGYCPGTREKGRRSPCLMGPFFPRLPLLPFVPRSQTVAAPFSSTLVPGEASESDLEPEPGGSAAGPPAAGLKVPGEASETEEEEEEEGRAARVPLPGVPRGGPSLLQQRLGAGEGRLRSAMAEALGRGFSGAARLLEGLGGPLGRARAGAAATAHCLCLVHRDLRAVAATVATVAACRLLPDIRGEP